MIVSPMALVGTSPSYFSMRVRAIALIWSSAVDAGVTETSLQVAQPRGLRIARTVNEGYITAHAPTVLS